MTKILITSGGTKVPIDRVRHIGNMSHGTFGSRIGTRALARDNEVVFVTQKGAMTPFMRTYDLYNNPFQNGATEVVRDFLDFYSFCAGYRDRYTQVTFQTPAEYTEVLKQAILTEKPDIVVLAAAVSDFDVKNYVDGKIRSKDALKIELEPLEKTIGFVKQWHPSCFLVGFKLLVDSQPDELIAAAKESIRLNGCNLVVANDLSDIQQDNHKLYLVYPNGKVEVREKNDKPDDELYLASQVLDTVDGLRE